MTFHGIAYGPNEHLLLTIDGAEVLAHDAHTEAPKWRVTIAQPLVAVLFAEPGALPASEGSNPWRSNSAGRTVVAVDREGGLHAIDPTLGQERGSLGPFGKALAVATGLGGILALATDDRIFLWRSGERTEIPGRASALAFSNDGATLAVGAPDGALRFLSVAGGKPPVETFCAVVHGGVTDLVQHPGGAWIVAGKSGVSAVTDAGPNRLHQVPAGAIRLALDPEGRRLAVQLSDRSLAVYAWPGLQLETQIDYVERQVGGLSFGPQNWLGVALDHGDGNKIDVVTSATHRTDTHPGRTHRSWFLSVRGKEAMLSAKEAEDIRRMKDPFHTPKPEKSNGGNGARIGIGAAISLGVLCLRLCAIGSRGSSSYPTYTPPPYNPITTPSLGSQCDRECAKGRLDFLKMECAGLSCYSSASEAVSALAAGDCRRARAAVARIGTFPVSSGGTENRNALGAAALSLASKGLADACSSDLGSGSLSGRHGRLVILEGTTLTSNEEDIPAASSSEGEEPRTIWAAPDGSVFVATVTPRHDRSIVHRRDKDGIWDVIARRRSTIAVQLWGRSATDLYIMDGDSLAHYDGTRTTEIAPPAPTLSALGGSGEDVLVIGESYGDSGDAGPTGPQVHRRHGVAGKWAIEPTIPGLKVNELWSGGGSVWAIASGKEAADGIDEQLLQRSPNGKWTERKWYGAKRPDDTSVQTVWVSPTGDAFVATSEGVFRSTGGGTSWSKTTGEAEDVMGLWGRSSSDVYATTRGGLLHYDGKKWSPTSHTRAETVIGGTPTKVFLVGATDD